VSTVTISETQDGKTVVAAADDEISIRLPENPATGYRWHAVASPRLLSIESDSFEPAKGSGIGGSGTRVFRYRSFGSGSDPLRFVLWREWEGEKSIIQQFQVTIEIG
jgi:inhibitor of cysteine peptidase